MTTKFSLSRWIGVRKHLERFWADTEIAPPDTLMLSEDERLHAAEAEWFPEWADTPSITQHRR